MFQGVYTAIITPFRDGKVDEKKLEELVAFQVGAGVKGIVPCGTTGEYLLLTREEQKRIIEICVKTCQGKAHVIPGTAALSINDTIVQTQEAQKFGANAALLVSPWYIKLSQESLYQYYKKISENVDLPLIIYNNPSRTGVDVSLETIMKLTSCKNIQGYKESGYCLQRISELKGQVGDRLSVLAGNDDSFAAHLGMGADGGILVAANVVPDLFVNLMRKWNEGDLPGFHEAWRTVFPLVSALALESNPAPIKYAMALVHGVSIESRLPFAPLNFSTQEKIEEALQDLNLWKPLVSVRER
ncbi:MAG: 4-hydroxy-tetrahydrodipicolinate synthase [Alphaproteobacteria bacterium 41-28]|nr:MAG: 4-hydroxy-tetrahydrodipicolinate synthase [Alphaproteobacteria bacterium 41-28]